MPVQQNSITHLRVLLVLTDCGIVVDCIVVIQVVDSVVGDPSDPVLSEEDIDKEEDDNDDDYDSVDGDSSVDSDPKRRIPRGFWQV
jgi:hypothetical protein